MPPNNEGLMNSITGSGGGSELSGPGTTVIGGSSVTTDVGLDFTVDDATWQVGIDYDGTSNRPFKIARTSFGNDAFSIDGATKNLTFGGDAYNGVGAQLLQHDNAGAVTSLALPDLQSVYDNSSLSQILTDGTLNAVRLRIGSGGGQADTDYALEIADQAGGVNVAVQGSGRIFSNGLTSVAGDIEAFNSYNITSVGGQVSGGTVVSTGAMTAGTALTVTAGVTTVNDDIVMRTGILDITEATTSTSVAANEIARMNFSGYDGSAFIPGAQIIATAFDTWSGSQRGTELSIETTATGATSPSPRLAISGSGSVVVWGDLSVVGNKVTVSGHLALNGISAPANGGANQALLYKKTSDDNMYWLPNTAGAEINITTPPAISVRQTTGQTFTSSGAVVTRVEFKSEIFKNDITHDNVTNSSRLTITKAGIYRVSYGVSWEAVVNGYRLNFVAVNSNVTGTDPRYARCQTNPDATDSQSNSGSALISLAVNDYVELWAQQDSGSDVDIGSTTVSFQGFFDANWVSS